MSRIIPQPEQPKNLQKSRTQTQPLNRTPSNLQPSHSNSHYLEPMDVQRTEKKRTTANLPYHAPVLMQQNKQLLAQNREMALVILQRNQLIERLQTRYKQKVADQQKMLEVVAIEKQKFVKDILNHRQKTQNQIDTLQGALSKLADQKQQLEIDYNRDKRTDGQKIEQQRKLQIQILRKQYQQNLSILQSENVKLKNQQEMSKNQIQLFKLQKKQEAQQLRSQTLRVKEELTHMEHIRRLQQAQLKHYYQNKIQKLHLDHRRDKELFLTQHQSQIQRLQDDINRLKSSLSQADSKIQMKLKQVAETQFNQENYTQKIQVQIREARETSKQQLIVQKKTTREILEAQHQGLIAASEQQTIVLQSQNQRLNELLATKTQALNSLYAQIDSLRDRYCTDLEQHQKIIAELANTVQTNELAHQEISQVLKAKLSCLRESDLKALRSFYEQQLSVLNQKLSDKEIALAASRQKYHNQLRLKSQMRQSFDLQLSKLKSQIKTLDSLNNDLQAQIAAYQLQISALKNQQAEIKANQDRSKTKNQQLRGDELQQLQAIIIAKDKQIEQLQQKLKLFKQHQEGQLKQKDQDLQQIKNQNIQNINQKQKEIERLIEQIKKLKNTSITEKNQFQQNVNNIKEQHSEEIDKFTQQLNHLSQTTEEQIRILKNENKNLNQQVNNLTRQLEENIIRAEQNEEQVKEQLSSSTNQQKQRLQQFYLQRLKQKQSAILQLHQRNQQLNNDLIDARQNYQAMQQKIEQMMEAHGSLRQLQRKIVHLGIQNNTVKNLRELYK